MASPKKSPLKIHMEKWAGGCGSEICDRGQHVCHIRGSVPADVAFVGEAPGDSEDVLGVPFKGPAGVHFQRYVIQEAIPHRKVIDPSTKEEKWVTDGSTYALINLVGCIPRNSEGIKDGAPEPDVIRKCAPRFLELLNIINPKLIVCVGKEAESALDPWVKASVLLVDKSGQKFLKTPRVTVLHPAFILRSLHLTNQGLAWQRAALTVEQAIDEYVLGDRRWQHEPLDVPKFGSGTPPDDDPDDPIPF